MPRKDCNFRATQGHPALTGWSYIYCGPAPAPQEFLLRWNFDPLALLLIAASTLATRRSGHGWGASLVLALAFVSPLCALSSALFSARVVHHILLVAVAAPLLALARPSRTQRGVGLSFLVSTAALWLWHLPAAYDAALGHAGIYWVMQASLLGTAWTFWRAVLSQPPASGAGWVFLAYVAMGMLGALLTLTPEPLYAIHATAPMVWGMTALADQQLGGLIMWIPAGLVFALWGGVLARRAWREMGAA